MRRIGSFILQIAVAVIGGFALVATSAEQPRIMSLSYSPSGVQSEARIQAGFSEAALRADLRHLAAHTHRIRTYSVDNGLDRAPRVARELGLKVSLGIWLGREPARNRAEIEKAITVLAAYPDTIDRVFVGNEAIVRGDLTAGEVIGYVRDVRRATTEQNLSIATAEPWHVWLAYPELAAEVDFIGAHLFGYWDGVPAADATVYVARRFDELRAAYPRKKIMIAETGWPSRGADHEAAVASPESQAAYVTQFLRFAADKGYDYNLVDAYDQPWKAPGEGGAYWGIFDEGGKPKFNY